MLSDAAAFGIEITAADLPDIHDTDLWLQNVPALQAFLAIKNQWRVAAGIGRLFYISLDYAAAESGLRMAGISITPELWSDVRQIEAGALQGMTEVSS